MIKISQINFCSKSKEIDSTKAVFQVYLMRLAYFYYRGQHIYINTVSLTEVVYNTISVQLFYVDISADHCICSVR